MDIVLEYVYPPITIRCFDWAATVGPYDLGCTVGWGATKEEAIEDLKNQLEEKE